MRPKIALINPNSSQRTTAAMLDIARRAAPRLEFVGLTAHGSVELIVDEKGLAQAACEVERLELPVDCDGAIVAAFGDPGLAPLRRRLTIPVIGIAEASMQAAAGHRKGFSVATTTPDLEARIRACAQHYGVADRLLSIRFTAGAIADVMSDTAVLEWGIREAVRECHELDGAAAVIIGGGPLAEVADVIARSTRIPILRPIRNAVRAMEEQLDADMTMTKSSFA